MVAPTAGGAQIVRIDVEIRADEVRRLLGYPAGAALPGRSEAAIEAAIAEARRLADGRGAHLALAPERAGELGLPPVSAEALAIGVATVGDAIERRASELMALGEPASALALDAAGSAAADEAADRLSAIIVGRGGEAPEGVACRLSPGYEGWPLEAQRRLLGLLPAAEVGVALTPSLLMVPRKSVSFAIWLGAAGPPGKGRRGCGECSLVGCRQRREESSP